MGTKAATYGADLRLRKMSGVTSYGGDSVSPLASPLLSLLNMTVELGLNGLELGVLVLVWGKMDVREKRGMLKAEEVLLCRLQGTLNCHRESSFGALAKGRVKTRVELSYILSSDWQEAFSAWC